MKKIFIILICFTSLNLFARDYDNCSLSFTFIGATEYPKMLSQIAKNKLSKRLYDLSIPNLEQGFDYTIHIKSHGLKTLASGIKSVVVSFELIDKAGVLIQTKTRTKTPPRLNEKRVEKTLYRQSELALKALFNKIPLCPSYSSPW